jgi:hypothetical protein
MPKRIGPTDFRAKRTLLPDEAFLLVSGKRPGPTDRIREEVWNGIMNLPDDVSLTTSNHHGAQLETLYSLWGNWIEAIGDERKDELFDGMLDGADCLQACTFDSLHGYYRSAVSNLRSALEVVAIGSLGNLLPNDSDYLRWREHHMGSLPFKSCMRKLRGVTDGPVRTSVLRPGGWLEEFYGELCAYAHSRPDSSDGQMWRSNGPIYVTATFSRFFEYNVSTYAACYIFTKVGRPGFELPKASEFIFKTPELLWSDEVESSYRILFSVSGA